MIDYILLVIWGAALFLVGAFWQGRKAARVERDLKSRIVALKLVNQSNRQELESLLQLNGLGQAVEKTFQAADHYQMKIEAGYPGTADWSFNRGVRHGLQSAVIFMRGWL